MKGRRKYIVLVAILLFVGVIAFGLQFAQPLLPSTAYVTTATLDGAPIRVELLSPPAMYGLYYIHLPEALKPRHPWQRYQWLGIAFSRQVVFRGPIYTGWGGFPFIHTDQAGGIGLTDSKIEDNWTVVFTADGVQFSNDSLSIALHRRP